MKELNETVAEQVGGGELWNYLRPFSQLPGPFSRPEPYPFPSVLD